MRREAIEAQLRANPYDDDAYAILADALQLEGDPRGELMMLDLRGDADGRTALLTRHPELRFAPPQIDLVWHAGYVRRATIHDEPYGLAHQILDYTDPAMRYLAELVFASPEVATPEIPDLPTLRMLAFGDPDLGFRHAYDGKPLELALDAIESLYSIVPIAVHRAPRLRALECFAMSGERLAWFARADLPALERLAFHVYAEIDPIAMLAAIPPTVTSLLIDAPKIGDRLLRALAKSPLLPRLRELQLWNADVERADAITREAFGHLALLDLSDPLLPDAVIERVRDICPVVRTLSPRVRALLGR